MFPFVICTCRRCGSCNWCIYSLCCLFCEDLRGGMFGLSADCVMCLCSDNFVSVTMCRICRFCWSLCCGSCRIVVFYCCFYNKVLSMLVLFPEHRHGSSNLYLSGRGLCVHPSFISNVHLRRFHLFLSSLSPLRLLSSRCVVTFWVLLCFLFLSVSKCYVRIFVVGHPRRVLFSFLVHGI